MKIRTILMAGVAGTVLAAAPLAIAQQSTPQNQPGSTTTTPNTTTPSTANAPAANAVQVDKLLDKSVRNANGEKIGDIEAVYVTPNGQVDSVIVGVGGFLGMGEREVAVKWSDLKVSADGETITSNMTKDSLKALPEYTYKDKTYRGRVFSDTGIYDSDRRPADMRATDTTRPAGSTSVRDNTTAGPRGTTMDTTRTDRPAMGGTTASPDRATRDTAAANRDATRKGFTKTGEMSADALIGTNVKNKQGETIGEIKDIHLNKDGSVKAAVVGVGGFLGMGERNVLMPWNQIEIARENDADIVVRTEASKDSLKAMPEYQM